MVERPGAIRDERAAARRVVESLQQAGHKAFYAGGCVRDAILGRPVSDYDVATSARPQEVQRLFKRTLKVGVQFGIVVAVFGPHKVEIATFRSDGLYLDGRRPDSVVFSSPEEDARRRDFTINGLFFDPLTEQVHDFVGGRQDLLKGVVRAIGSPQDRFNEDHLRLIRAVRFAARLHFRIDSETRAAIVELRAKLAKVSAERLLQELTKILGHRSRARGLAEVLELGILAVIDDELAADVGRRRADTERCLDLLGQDPVLPWAILCDSPERADRVLRRLRSSNELREGAVALLEAAPDFAGYPGWPLSKRKRLLRLKHRARHLELLRLRILASTGDLDPLLAIDRDLAAYGARGDGSIDAPPLVTGDLLKELGLRPGRRFKVLLDAAEDAQLEGEVDRDALIAQLRARFPEDFPDGA